MGASSTMAHGNERSDGCRAERVKFLGTVLALIQLRNGEQVRAKLHELSANGGVLHIAEPLDEALSIELVFQIGSTTVRNQAKLLGPIWATTGCLQPFRFTGLSDEVRNKLQNDLAGYLGSRHN